MKLSSSNADSCHSAPPMLYCSNFLHLVPKTGEMQWKEIRILPNVLSLGICIKSPLLLKGASKWDIFSYKDSGYNIIYYQNAKEK